MENEKICKICNELKNIKEFKNNTIRKPNGYFYNTICNKCKNKKALEKRHEDKKIDGFVTQIKVVFAGYERLAFTLEIFTFIYLLF